MAIREFQGAAVQTTLSGSINAGATSITITSASGWPTGASTDTFVVVIDRGLASEEKVLIESRSSTTLTVATSGRGYDGTSAASHSSGATIEHCIDAVWLNDVNDHVAASSAAHAASAISNTPAGSIAATTVQAALNELDTDVVAALAHVSDTSAAHAATAISVDSAGLTGTGTDLQAVLEELDNAISAGGGDISTHLADTTDAHDASAISFSPTGNLSSTDVQSAIAEVVSDLTALLVPSGSVFAFAGSSAPTGFLVCDGSSLLRSSYAALFSAIGTTYGAADGTHFNLPNIQGRTIFGKEASATRLTSGVSGVDGATLGATGGSQSLTGHTHTGPSHSHTGPSHTHTTPAHSHDFAFSTDALASTGSSIIGLAAGGDFSPGIIDTTAVDGSGTTGAGGTGTTGASGTGATGSTGNGSSENIPPAIVLNYIIKT